MRFDKLGEIKFHSLPYAHITPCDVEAGSYRRGWNDAIDSINSIIDNQTIIEPEIIRCKDCKYWQDQQEGVVEVPICARPENQYEEHPFRFMIGEDGYCSFAERRTDE